MYSVKTFVVTVTNEWRAWGLGVKVGCYRVGNSALEPLEALLLILNIRLGPMTLNIDWVPLKLKPRALKS